MKKKLDVDRIQSELRGGSAFFPGYQSDSPPKSTNESVETSQEDEKSQNALSDRAVARPSDEAATRPGGRPTGIKGILVRRGFEWREDQLRALKKLSLQDQMEGKSGSMSQMVRDALDDYLKKRASEI